jgi:hypothetical protein
VKADAKLKSMKLAREPRLSVQPVTDEEWKLICKMGGVNRGVSRHWRSARASDAASSLAAMTS